MIVVGLTGGIGSGKSSVSEIFEGLGVKVVDADVASRQPVMKGQPALKKILLNTFFPSLAVFFYKMHIVEISKNCIHKS